jgi:UDP-glucose 4-epimerase
MKVMVTGGAGFIGSHIVDALIKDGHDVLVLDNFYSGREKNLDHAFKLAAQSGRALEKMFVDISNALIWGKMPAVEAIFHVAAQTSVTASVKESHRDFSWNILSSKFLTDYIKNNQVKYVLYTNTAGALYGEANTLPTPEDHPLYPSSPYGATKSFFETYMRALAQSLKMEGSWSNDPQAPNYFTWASLRLGNVYGPRQITKGEAGVIPIFIEKFLAHATPTIFGTGEETRDYIHVEDVVSAFMHIFKLQQSAPVDDAYNVGAGKEIPTEKVYNVIKNALTLEGLPEKAELQPSRPGELKRSCLNIEKLKKTGWSPKWEFENGAKQTVISYLELEKSAPIAGSA